MAITLTEAAVKELKRILETQRAKANQAGEDSGEPEKVYVRVAVSGGGCSGFSYDMSLADRAGEHDEQFVQDGIELICDPKSYIYLNGTTIDFADELMERGFRFKNPNASSTCGCGASFGV